MQNGDFEAALTTFYCYDHGAKGSEAVQKITTGQREYCKYSVCYNLVNDQNIPINQWQWRMVGCNAQEYHRHG